MRSQMRVQQLADGRTNNPYLPQENFSDGSVCHDCGAVHLDGRWQWSSSTPTQARSVVCPACQRQHEKVPDGYVTLQGKFAREHGDELLNFIRQFELHEKSEHPMHRIMSIDKRAEKLLITTTDAHLARSIGKALHHIYKGKLDFNYKQSDMLLRVLWQR